MLYGQLRIWRGLLQLTQAEAAHELKVSLAQYSNYERGKAEIPGKIELATQAIAANRQEMAKKLDGRFKKPVDYVAEYGQPVWLYLKDGSLAHERLPQYYRGRKGDSVPVPRAKTLEAAIAQRAAHWPIRKTEERDDGFHIWLDVA